MALRARLCAQVVRPVAGTSLAGASTAVSFRGYRSDDSAFFRSAGASTKNEDASNSGWAGLYVVPAALLAGGIAFSKLSGRSHQKEEALHRLEALDGKDKAISLKRTELKEQLAKEDRKFKHQLDTELAQHVVPDAAVPAMSWKKAEQEEDNHLAAWNDYAIQPKHPRDLFFGAGSGSNEFRNREIEQGLVRVDVFDNRADDSILPASWFKKDDASQSQKVLVGANNIDTWGTMPMHAADEKDKRQFEREALERDVNAKERELTVMRELRRLRDSTLGKATLSEKKDTKKKFEDADEGAILL